MTRTDFSADLLISMLTDKTADQCRIVDVDFDPLTRLITLEIEGADVPDDAIVAMHFKKVNGVMGSKALVFEGFEPVKWEGVDGAAEAPASDEQAHFDITDAGEVVALDGWESDHVAIELRLLQASVEATQETIAGWTDDQCRQADCWAIAVQFNASDHDDIQVPPKPDFLPAEKPFGGAIV